MFREKMKSFEEIETITIQKLVIIDGIMCGRCDYTNSYNFQCQKFNNKLELVDNDFRRCKPCLNKYKEG
jgi:hypothetical protein